MFDPKTDKFPYPEKTDAHYLIVKKNDGTVFDGKYPYIDASPRFRRRQRWTHLLLRLIVFPLAKVRLGLRVEGRENLKKYRDVLQNGVISVSNHVHMWDYIALMKIARPHWPYVLVWAPNVSGESGRMVRSVGGIPIPEGGAGATLAYVRALGGLLREHGWLQVYAEGSMWEYYAPIRPFKCGAAQLACEFDKPILPMGFSYRRPSWVRRILFRQIACFTLTVGEPLYADASLPKRERTLELTKRCHAAVCRLCGIEPEENLYPPVFDDTERIDYYTGTYGVGYRGSH